MNNLLNNYAGFLVDSHITDHDESFQRRLDPAAYVAMVKRAGADSVIVPAMCCMSNCYYPSSVESPGDLAKRATETTAE